MGGVGYIPNKQTQILRTLKLTGHFIQFFVVETEQFVNSNPNVILTWLFFCLFVCCYKTRKFLLRPWAPSKTTWSISTRAA